MTSAIILVGFMGAGKTSVGRIVARRLGWDFVDLDDRIVAREGRSVAEIFSTSGEEYFRRLESECLRGTLAAAGPGSRGAQARQGVVIALGGGAYVQSRNQEMIATAGVPVVFLDATPEELYRRCGSQVGTRPLLRDENQFRQLYEARRESYMKAGVRIDTTALAPEQVAEEVERNLKFQI